MLVFSNFSGHVRWEKELVEVNTYYFYSNSPTFPIFLRTNFDQHFGEITLSKRRTIFSDIVLLNSADFTELWMD